MPTLSASFKKLESSKLMRSLLSYPLAGETYRRVFWLTMGLFVALWLSHTWFSDDSLITFRQVLNFTEGHGMVYNWGERVQAFTHTSWFLLLSVVHVLSGGLLEPTLLNVSAFLLSLVFCLVTIWLLLKRLKGLPQGVAAVLLLALFSSQAFIDYTSSGLENPLSYFLVALIVIHFFENRFESLFFILCALLFLNRMDYALLLLPLCLYAWRACDYRIAVLVPAIAVCLSWLVFATWYFGYPLPNTFLAKSNIDASIENFVKQGSLYYFRTLTQDPVTLFVILSLMAACIYDTLRSRAASRLVAVGGGLVLYSLYLLWIGGDFMQGRFFSVPFIFALFCGSYILHEEAKLKMNFKHFLIPRKFIIGGLSLLVAVSCISCSQRIKESFFLSDKTRQRFIHGIANERGFYIIRWIKYPIHFQSFEDSVPSSVRLDCCSANIVMKSDGSEYLVDNVSLSSPYLSRLPAEWGRVGHWMHPVPTDFEAWIVNASDSTHDPRINDFFSDIREVVRGRLFSWNRVKKITKINSHNYGIEFKSPYFLQRNKKRFSKFHPSLQTNISLPNLRFYNRNIWKIIGGRRGSSNHVTQSISVYFKRQKIRKITLPVGSASEKDMLLPVFNTTEYSWALYDGQKKVYEDSYKTEAQNSYNTFVLPREIQGDRLEVVFKSGGIYRRLARPILE